MLFSTTLTLLLMASTQPDSDQVNLQLPFLSPVFGEHMVLQRDKSNTIWGWTAPGEKIEVEIDSHRANATADRDGKWSVKILPPKAGGPYKLTVRGSKTVELKDILVGDVWICSGQSNMEMGLSQVKDGPEEVAKANHPNIRLFMVEKASSTTPLSTVTGKWKTCTPENVATEGWGGFSAVGYFFGRHLQAELNVPIGLVESSWGGTTAEAWASPSALATIQDFKEAVEITSRRLKPGSKSTQEEVDAWAKANDPGSKGKQPYSKEDLGPEGFKEVEGPPTLADIGLADSQSVIWYRHEFNISADNARSDANIQTGSYDGVADYYINGEHVANQASVLVWGNFVAPKGLLREGKNTIAIRGIGHTWSGGFNNGKDSLMIYFGNGAKQSLRGTWKYKETLKLAGAPTLPPLIDGNPFWPASLNNAMIQPLVPMAIKGAIWYQGESNVGRAAQYEKLLPAMITDWRKSFGQGDFPFYVVQLANYGQRHPEPVDDGWPALRVAQQRGTEAVANSGYIVIHDIGEGADIHPKNKQDVGHRLALLALRKTYNKEVFWHGPLFKSAAMRGSDVVLTFEDPKGLVLKNTSPHSGFAIAGADKVFHWAEAKVDGSTVILHADGVPSPTMVRYAWDADPLVTLFNTIGLPAGPFEASITK